MRSNVSDAYRPDIDGLRAIAVTSVVAFHASPTIVRGGFVGVDIFFVISGYLITQLLLREASKTGTIGLAEFYARRIRRLFPALVTMVLVVLVASHFLLLPVGEQQRLSQSAIATAGYISNFYFKAAAGDYFAGPAEQQPLLHTWSLSVEEQYYLFWPLIVMIVCWFSRRGGRDLRRSLVLAIAPLAVISLVLYLRWSAHATGVAFYYLPARAWELGAGALLALVLEIPTSTAAYPLREPLFVVGLAALVGSALFIDSSVAPGPAVVVPVCGTVACLAAGARGSRLARLSLGHPAPVAIGKVSYSWYLWHWPMLALARAHALGEADPRRDWALVVCALGLATLTLKLVENPIRHNRPGPFARKWPTIAIGVALSGVVVVGALGLVGLATHQAHEPRYAELLAIRGDVSPLREHCHITSNLPPREQCTLPGTDPRRELVVWGDSHAERMFAPVAEFARLHSIPVVQRTSTACPPLLGVRPSTDDHRPNDACRRFNEAVMTELAERVRGGAHDVTVVLVARWPNYLATTSPEGVATRTLYDEHGMTRDADELLRRGLDATLAELDRLGINAVVVAAMPEMPRSAPECRVRDPEHCGISRAEAEQYRSRSQTIVERVVASRAEHARLVDAFAALCDRDRCAPMLDGKLAYTDAHHLAFSAAAKLVDYFDAKLRWSLGL